MSEYRVRLPDVGEGIAEAEIVEWHVGVGDTIHEDDVIAEVMTDKATIELPSPVDGIVRWLGGEVGDVLAVGSDLVRIDTEGEADAADAGTGTEALGTEALMPAATLPPPPPSASPAPSADVSEEADKRPAATSARSKAAPAVRARAHQLGVDLGTVAGTGPDGRITHADLDAVVTTASPQRRSVVPGDDSVETVKVTGLRRNIAERMQASKRRIPHFTYVEEVDVTEVERLRHELNATRSEHQPKLSLLPFLMQSVIHAVGEHPAMNARFDDEAGVIHRHRAVHLGIAVQTVRGLMVTVVKHAGDRDLWGHADELARLSAAARSAKITLEELTGSTITITSLGALGGIVSTPVINAPEVAIIGVNKIVDRPVYVDGVLARRKIMNLSSSFDHRVIDGADAAAFVQSIRRRLETPALLLLPTDPG
ncbi:MAG: dihydrolipoamide acetyltransferase family protein [Acidimicrobiia bacterium]